MYIYTYIHTYVMYILVKNVIGRRSSGNVQFVLFSGSGEDGRPGTKTVTICRSKLKVNGGSSCGALDCVVEGRFSKLRNNTECLEGLRMST